VEQAAWSLNPVEVSKQVRMLGGQVHHFCSTVWLGHRRGGTMSLRAESYCNQKAKGDCEQERVEDSRSTVWLAGQLGGTSGLRA